jgi:hypothetical protein
MVRDCQTAMLDTAEREKDTLKKKTIDRSSEPLAKPEIINTSSEFVARFGFQRRKNSNGALLKAC